MGARVNLLVKNDILVSGSPSPSTPLVSPIGGAAARTKAGVGWGPVPA